MLRDIYGHSESIDVTVVIEMMTTTPTDFPQCYSQSGVVTQPFVQDAVYVVGTLKEVKVHFTPLPRTASGVDCESLLVVSAEWMESAWTSPQRMPWFMTSDSAFRRIKLFIPRVQAPDYLGKTYRIRVRSYIRGHESEQKSISFKVAIIES